MDCHRRDNGEGGAAGPGPVLRSGRLLLRPLRRSDAGPIALYAGDARVARMTTGIPHPYPPGAAEAFIEAALSGRRSGRAWVMDGTPSGAAEMIGLIEARPRADGATEIGFWVGPPFWNTGYATEALVALADALAAAGQRRLVAQVFADNPASAQVLIHAGFAETGQGSAFSVARGQTVPTRVFERKDRM
ncbi:MAG: N-acetyltransferase [Paracoccaceae bacterium]|nr:MAG: N-acetyltransferase [Paracoccaceae bacterium]